MEFYNVPVNRSVPTKASRGLSSYKCHHLLQSSSVQGLSKSLRMSCQQTNTKLKESLNTTIPKPVGRTIASSGWDGH
jgi:hypothetical protein